MISFLIRRLSVAVLVFVTVSIVSFTLLHLSGDLAHSLAGPEASAEEVEVIRHQYGLDKPLYLQYFDWLQKAAHGDLGSSLFYDESVSSLIAEHLPVTIKLSIFAQFIALVIAIPLGVLGAMNPGGWLDRIGNGIAVLGQGLPNFWFALILMVFLGVTLRILPISGDATWRNYVMPSIALGYYQSPPILRATRSGMIDVLASDYVRTAWAKGLRAPTVLFKHALRNAIVPVVALIAVNFGHMLSGSVVIESIFALPGIGYLAYQSIYKTDFPVVQALVILVSMFFIVMVVIADLLNAWLDPRIRLA